MGKFTNASNTVRQGPLKTAGPTVATYNRGVGYALDKQTELFTLGVTNKVSEDTFYESGVVRDRRFVDLVHEVTKATPEWAYNFIVWLRNEGNMRSASVVAVAEYIHAGGPNGRKLVSDTLARADEPAELLAYWKNKYGNKLPASLKRGVADAALKLYNEYTIQKYDGVNAKWRFADVIQLTHPKPDTEAQSALFKYALERRYNGSDAVIPEALTKVAASKELAGKDKSEITTDDLRQAGWTWERLSSTGSLDKAAWEAVIPTMGYMALLRNLRNFENAGVSYEVVDSICAKLANPDEVAKSKQFPFRFYSAYKNSGTMWHSALERALGYSFKNIPDLGGKTKVFIDVSGSMSGSNFGYNRGGSAGTGMTYSEIAAVAGLAFARKTGADVIAFGTSSMEVDVSRDKSVLKYVQEIGRLGNRVGHGTNISAAVKRFSGNADRIVVFTDMQCGGGDLTSTAKFKYGFDLRGYGSSKFNTARKGEFLLGGFTDATFSMMKNLEAAQEAKWPWEN